jgi:hypothetical protein
MHLIINKNENAVTQILKMPNGVEFLANIKNNSNYSALHAATEKHGKIIFEYVNTTNKLEFLAHVKDNNGYSVLHAIVFRDKDIAIKLIENNKGLEILTKTKTNSGYSAFYIAVQSNRKFMNNFMTEERKKLFADAKRSIKTKSIINYAYNNKDIKCAIQQLKISL